MLKKTYLQRMIGLQWAETNNSPTEFMHIGVCGNCAQEHGLEVLIVSSDSTGKCPYCQSRQGDLACLWKYKGEGRWQTGPHSRERRIAGTKDAETISEVRDALGAWDELIKQAAGTSTKL